jgi:dipeptidyl aminopeptidase/acylaminoacyl peptidase
MRKISLMLVLTGMLIMTGRVWAGSKLIPLRDFFKNAVKTGFQISPDGEYLSYLQPYQNRYNIFVQKRGRRAAVRISRETERDIAGYFWKGNDRLLYLKDFQGDENYHIVAVNRSGDEIKDLTPFPGVRAEIIDTLVEDEHRILVGLNKRDRQVFDVYRLNVQNGELQLVAENPGNIMDWLTDHQGRLRVALTSDGSNTSLLYREDETDPFKTVITTDFREMLQPVTFTPDNRALYAVSNIGRDKAALVKYGPGAAKELEVVYSHPEVDVGGLSYSRKRQTLIAVSYTTWKRERHFFDPQFKAIYERLQQRLPKYELSIVDTNLEEDLLIVRTYSDRSLGAYYLYEAARQRLTKLADVSPWLKERKLCEVKPIEYQSRDGFTIHGYLTLPRGKKAQNLPVVVNPHGGPWSRDVWGFDPEVQFLANRGYAVLQMNFRGSTGYGRRFWEASFKQWGRKMQDDITDGVNWLIKQGVADPQRIAIYGGSYGGYATLAGVTFTPDLYACGIDYVGVSNLLTFMNSIPPYWKPLLEQMYQMVGDPQTEVDRLREASPVFHADRIKVPLLVAQGAKDPRVNINESDQIVAELKKRGVPVEYLVKEDEGHGFSNEENRFEFYEAMERFLERNLGRERN